MAGDGDGGSVLDSKPGREEEIKGLLWTVERVRADALALCEAEETAATIRCYGSTDIPHLLRTEAYARRRWAWARQHSIWQPAADAAAELLPRRQAALHRTARAPWSFVVREGAIMTLENKERDLDVAIDQLRHLLN